ncbi:MAG: energy-coupling factor ABC transporter ATP-binding protein [Candidatus Odinarchaeia archaeon]
MRPWVYLKGRHKIITQIKKALSKVGLDSYEKRVTYKLSIGEKKRLCIASILPIEPEILVFDEPTSNLDPQSVDSLLNLINEFKKQGKTMIVATHNMEFISNIADRCYVISDGRIRLEGLASDVLTAEKELIKYGLKPPIVTMLFKEAGFPQPYPITFEDVLKQLSDIIKHKK